MKVARGIIFAVAALCAIFGIGYLHQPLEAGDLVRPIEVVDIRALSDGGSIFALFEDKNGNKLFVEEVQDLSRARAQLFVGVYIFGLVPYHQNIDNDARAKAEVRQLLDYYLNAHLTQDQRRDLEAEHPLNLSSKIDGKTLGIAQLWLFFR